MSIPVSRRPGAWSHHLPHSGEVNTVGAFATPCKKYASVPGENQTSSTPDRGKPEPPSQPGRSGAQETPLKDLPGSSLPQAGFEVLWRMMDRRGLAVAAIKACYRHPRRIFRQLKDGAFGPNRMDTLITGYSP